jgi:eukaryotic-like serine/threonine-protein kinase
MTIAAGTRLGSYEVIAPLGVGGMGQVFRARDTRLGREVAIKVLPPEFVSDPERVARFQREAQVLASLNHPHIAQIYGLEDAGGVRALVMELVDGEMLDQRLTRGRIAVDDALPIAKQIAEALEAAHEKGIIHRDLKPSNIALTKDGQVKVLDFGLAKLAAPDAAGAASSLPMSPTITSPVLATGVGVLLGTPAYMSPEQAKGREADKRSDVWAFGCVLYEMLTATRAFAADDVVATLAYVLTKEPDWSKLPPGVPRVVATVLRRCLVKDRGRRIAEIAVLRFAFEESIEPASVPAAPTRSPWSRLRAAASALLLGAAAAVLGGAAARWFDGREDPAGFETRVDLQLPTSTDGGSIALAPDGQAVAFVSLNSGQPELWIRRLNDRTARRLPGTEGAASPFWSPDSRSIAFFTPRFLKRVDVDGGRPQSIAPTSFGNGGAWSPQGVIIYNAGFGAGLTMIPATGGARERFTSEPGVQYPQFLPDGRHFLVFVQRGDGSYIGVGAVGDPGIRKLVTADSPPGYLKSGWLLYLRQDVLSAQRFDTETAQVRGDPVVVAQGVERFSASPAGPVVYRAPVVARNEFHWFNASGKDIGLFSAGSNPSIAADGRRVLVDRTIDGNRDVWLVDGVRSTRMTIDAANEMIAIWSPDNRHITFRSMRAGNADIYDRAVDGATGSEQPLVVSPLDEMPSDWSPDGRFLLYYTVATDAQRDVYIWSAADRKSVPFRNGPYDEAHGQFSPDGRWVAYDSDEAGRYEVYVARFAADGSARTQWQVSTEGGTWPRWSHTGSTLFYISAAGDLMSAAVDASHNAPAIAKPTPLFHVPLRFDPRTAPQYAVANDGRFLVRVDNQEAPPLTLLLHWAAPK